MILDVGSGYRPYEKADVLVDAYRDNRSRKADIVIPPGKEFIFADVRALPFPNKAFEYVWCNHTLEHVESGLEDACNELMRVANAGHIGLPNYSYDKKLDRPYHHWWCFIDTDELIFVPRNFSERDLEPFIRLPDIMGGISLEWSDTFKYRIIKR